MKVKLRGVCHLLAERCSDSGRNADHRDGLDLDAVDDFVVSEDRGVREVRLNQLPDNGSDLRRLSLIHI